MQIDYKRIQKNIDDFTYGSVRLNSISEEGVAVDLFVPSNIDLLDFIESLGIYFYRIDDPKFGQKFINEDTKLYIYDWLTQILNTGNYEENEEEEQIFSRLELCIDFENLNTFKYALRKYKEILKTMKNSKDVTIEDILAAQTAIAILEIIEKIRLITLD